MFPGLSQNVKLQMEATNCSGPVCNASAQPPAFRKLASQDHVSKLARKIKIYFNNLFCRAYYNYTWAQRQTKAKKEIK